MIVLEIGIRMCRMHNRVIEDYLKSILKIGIYGGLWNYYGIKGVIITKQVVKAFYGNNVDHLNNPKIILRPRDILRSSMKNIVKF